MPPSLITLCITLHIIPLLLQHSFLNNSGVVGVTTANAINGFTVVVVRESAAETLRQTPAGALLQLPPYSVRLSSNWTVVERQVVGGSDSSAEEKEEEEEGRLLHCRLPLPQLNADVRRLEAQFVRRYETRTSADIWRWLMRLTQFDGCIFGDGEGGLTGVSEWYRLCLRGELRKLNKTAINTLYDNVSSLQIRKKVVKRLMQQTGGEGMVNRGGRGNSSNSNSHNNNERWSFVIGEYRHHITRPRWNSRRRVWELVYPSKRICDAWRADVLTQEMSRVKKEKDELLTIQFEKEERWESVIRLYCSQRQKVENVLQWSITEIRQACLHEILLHSPVVCEWERELENLRVNPIPCVAI
ncbi:hypothetical protein LSM04_005000 [Trypanosoma melophagium]|uniref:uncharacterized protein n=1 Tax=Trypanosoma melophagium TaxID=715481 RepID=UPI003519EBFE|nr:hypothetical protein LSM04_005000 [Trypanosoma melophagium]